MSKDRGFVQKALVSQSIKYDEIIPAIPIPNTTEMTPEEKALQQIKDKKSFDNLDKTKKNELFEPFANGKGMMVFDLDGTFLDDDKGIPSNNIDMVIKLKEKYGIIPVIATARPLKVVQFIESKSGKSFDGYIISLNGSVIYEFKNKKIVQNIAFTNKQAQKIMHLARKNGLESEFMTLSQEWADIDFYKRREKDPMYYKMSKTRIKNGKKFWHKFREFSEEELDKRNIDKEEFKKELKFNFLIPNEMRYYSRKKKLNIISISGTEVQLKSFKEKLEKLKLKIQISELCNREDASGEIKDLKYIDIMVQGVTKWEAIKHLQEILGISSEQTITFGDGGNDQEMTENAGIGVAMQNSTNKRLIESADIVTEAPNQFEYDGTIYGGVGILLYKIMKELDRIIERKNIEAAR